MRVDRNGGHGKRRTKKGSLGEPRELAKGKETGSQVAVRFEARLFLLFLIEVRGKLRKNE